MRLLIVLLRSHFCPVPLSSDLCMWSGSEKKIDYFGNRLAGIEDLLRELTISLKNGPSSTGSTSAASVPRTSGQQQGSSASDPRTTGSSAAEYVFDDGADSDASSDVGDLAFEGTSSMTAHTVQASEFLEHVVERERWNSQQMSPNMQSALTSLQQIVSMQQKRKKGRIMGSMSRHEIRFPNQKPVPEGGLKDLPMPPVQTVVSLLREIKGRISPAQAI